MKKGYIYLILTTILFSTMEITLKSIMADFNPVQINLLRFCIGGLFLLPFALKGLKKKGLKLKRGDYIFFFLTGFIGITVSMTLYQMAIIVSQASTVAIIFSCNAVFVIPLAFFILKEKIRPYIIISMIISLAGIVFIMNPLHMSWASVTGIILSLLAAITFALYGVVGKFKSLKYGGLVTTCFSFLMATIEMAVIVLISHIPAVSDFLSGAGFGTFADIPVFKGIKPGNLLRLAYVCFCVTGLGYSFYFMAIEKTSASLAALVFYIKPALAPLLAFLLIHDIITSNTIAGIYFIIAGSAVAFIGNARAAGKQKK